MTTLEMTFGFDPSLMLEPPHHEAAGHSAHLRVSAGPRLLGDDWCSCFESVLTAGLEVCFALFSPTPRVATLAEDFHPGLPHIYESDSCDVLVYRS